MITSATFLFIFLASFCNAEGAKHTDLKFEDDTYIDYDNIPKLDDKEFYGPNALRDFYSVSILGIIALQFNLFGSLYVIYRTYLQLRRGGKNNVPLSLRFPFYIALTDAFLSISFTVNLGYTVIWKLPWSNPACKIIGASVSTLFTLNIILVGLVALTTWCCVCREYYIEFGLYDYKLWTITILLSAAFFYFSLNQSGQQKFWCAGKHHNAFVPLTMIIIIVIILLTILACYIRVLLKIRSNDSILISSYQRPIERRALRKLISYIFTFIIQFIPLLAYNFFTLAGLESILLDVLAVTTINFGGIGNFIQFAINEGLTNSAKLSSPSSSMDQNAQPETTVVVKPIISVTTHTEVTQSNINNNPDGITPDLTSNDTNDIVHYNNRESNLTSNDIVRYSNRECEMIDINIDTIDENNDIMKNEDAAFDGTNLVSANSQNALLSDDHDFQQEITEYTSHLPYS